MESINRMKSRIVWIDRLKAFLIFCVVFGHIETISIGDCQGVLCKLQDAFCMPCFFFLSGLFLKKYDGFMNLVESLKKKALQLLVPFFFCGLTYTFYMNRSLISLIYLKNGGAHNGYWFVLVLFELFIVYSLSQLLIYKLPSCLKKLDGLFVFFIVSFFLKGIDILGIIPRDTIGVVLSYPRLSSYFMFYCLGFVFMNNETIRKLVLSKIVFAVSLIAFFVLFVSLEEFSNPFLLFMIRYVLSTCGVIILVQLFYNCNEVPCYKTIDHCICFVGERTLEIYLLHYFFLPHGLELMKPVFQTTIPMNSNLILEFFVCSIFAVFVIFFSLLLSWIIKKSQLLSLIYLGNHNNKSKE